MRYSSSKLRKAFLCMAASSRAAARLFCASAHGIHPPPSAASRAAAPSANGGAHYNSPSRLGAMLAHNARFVQSGAYKDFAPAPDSPDASRCVILTCMDSRLSHLLPAALNIKRGEAKMIKTAGAIVSHPWGGIMRSIVVALYELRASEVFVVGHDDCGMRTVAPGEVMKKMLAGGVPEDRFQILEAAGVDVHRWLKNFVSVDESVLSAVKVIKSHPLVPPNLLVTGLVIDPATGALRLAASQQGQAAAGGAAASSQ